MTDETPDVVSRARAALDGITPGPWEVIGGGEYVSGPGICVAPDDGGVSDGDGAFIAAAPDLVRDLVAKVERLTKHCDDFCDAIEENGKGWDESQAWAAWFAAERDFYLRDYDENAKWHHRRHRRLRAQIQSALDTEA
ncbi:hypothetical protein JVX90_00155 [Gordonia sp. PDNC005]|uniref:hypothetical protein n=1 Tax=Gordonia sp. PDNC005 TaxID=2811424 RepID=UPI001964EE4D|nr:hypothetical protein [Gordonia sp. PDNC005]QRY62724.1 hypothetical protein JVX90_00155 [Gordonia sp. PDNC005]